MSQGKKVPPRYNNGSTELCDNTANQHREERKLFYWLVWLKPAKEIGLVLNNRGKENLIRIQEIL